ncbi:uncharacterized protein LOC132743043 isoform X2 [Ruditapes philippinarum]|uniref:uncharacterized protein LOC132743043 isoform X2 n=1 Tax=Ruditapes philippinarum TaxID=129788 RepID=UPI00295AEF57|nr:uncharacterized protein LOC132743043 isoform X2 [Ruditapes philippinarum]
MEEIRMTEITELMREALFNIANDLEGHRTANCKEQLENIVHILLDEMSQISTVHENVVDLINAAIRLLEDDEDRETRTAFKPNLCYTNNKGWPSYQIAEETLKYYVENDFSVNDISSILNVSSRTIARRLQYYSLSIRNSYSNIDDNELDELVASKVQEFPNSGYRTIYGHLKSVDVRIQISRVREAIKRVDPCAVAVRRLFMQHYRIKRRRYNVEAPMALWHVDTNHKLIRWRFVIHAGIDGYSRLPTYTVIAPDNTSETALNAFKSGVIEYGVPHRVRTDKGKENIGIAEFMLQHWGIDSKSHITGRSVHNQRIERFWREVWQGCTGTFHQLFSMMEESGMMNADSELDLIALHSVFLERIQQSLNRFRLAVSRRPLRTEGNKSPLQLWILGQGLPVLNLSADELSVYGIDFDGPIHTSQGEIVVPSLYNVPDHIQDGMNEIKSRTSQIDEIFETDTYLALKEYLHSQLNLF